MVPITIIHISTYHDMLDTHVIVTRKIILQIIFSLNPHVVGSTCLTWRGWSDENMKKIVVEIGRNKSTTISISNAKFMSSVYFRNSFLAMGFIHFAIRILQKQHLDNSRSLWVSTCKIYGFCKIILQTLQFAVKNPF